MYLQKIGNYEYEGVRNGWHWYPLLILEHLQPKYFALLQKCAYPSILMGG